VASALEARGMDADATLATVAAGRAATVAQLRTLAAQLEELPLDSAAEVLIALEHPLAELRLATARALERTPPGAG
jgi:hypothetical protein